MKTLIIIPAYNEQQVVGCVIVDLKKFGFLNVALINDGSNDKTSKIASDAGAFVLDHPVNMGLGAALRTGFAYAIKNKYDEVITCDADGQHSAEDVRALCDFSQNSPFDLVVGVRNFGKYRYKKLINMLADIVTSILAGNQVRDSQSGLRFIRVGAIKKMELFSTEYAISSEILIEASRQNLKIGFFPIKAIYTDYSTKKQIRQKLSNIFGMIRQLLE